ncbi:hypothetical protein ScPMuIL_007177 [Solemya velum]
MAPSICLMIVYSICLVTGAQVMRTSGGPTVLNNTSTVHSLSITPLLRVSKDGPTTPRCDVVSCFHRLPSADSDISRYLADANFRRDTCLAHDSFKACISACHFEIETQLTHDSAEVFLNYMCGNGKPELERHIKCWTDSDIRQGLHKCEQDAKSVMEYHNNFDDKFCKYINRAAEQRRYRDNLLFLECYGLLWQQSADEC